MALAFTIIGLRFSKARVGSYRVLRCTVLEFGVVKLYRCWVQGIKVRGFELEFLFSD